MGYHNILVFQSGQVLPELQVQFIQSGGISLIVCLVGFLMLRVRLYERIPDVFHLYFGIHGVEPHMGIICPPLMPLSKNNIFGCFH